MGTSEALGARDAHSSEILMLSAKHLLFCVWNFWVTRVFMECLGWARSQETAANSQLGAA